MASIFGAQFDQSKFNTRFFNSYYEHDISYGSQVRTERWDRVQLLGKGGFGAVWLEKSEAGELRAVKQIPKQAGWQDKFSQREPLAMTTLSEYPQHFVRFFGWFEDQKNIYIAMEYIEHGDLRGLLSENSITENDAKVITKQILEGLKIMNQHSFCHRDINPQNILVVSSSPPIVKITDFGVSKQLVEGTELRTEIGTEDYKAPEITGFIQEDTSVYSNAVDIWSLGCLIHVMLTRRLPFLSFRSINRYIQAGVFPTPEPDSNSSLTAFQFIAKLMKVQPNDRLTPEQALREPWLNH